MLGKVPGGIKMNPKRRLAPARYVDKGMGFRIDVVCLLSPHNLTCADTCIAGNAFHSRWAASRNNLRININRNGARLTNFAAGGTLEGGERPCHTKRNKGL